MRQKLSEVDGLIALILSITHVSVCGFCRCLQSAEPGWFAPSFPSAIFAASPLELANFCWLSRFEIHDWSFVAVATLQNSGTLNQNKERVWNVDYHTSTWEQKKRLSLMAETVNVWWLEVKLYAVTRSWKGIHYQLAPGGILVAPFLPLPLICSRLGVCGCI